MSDLDLLSDLDEREGMSPQLSDSSLDDANFLDEVRSELSGSSWASAGARSR